MKLFSLSQESSLLQLSPQCSDILLRCFWENKEIECIDSKGGLLSVRQTQYGPCCTFNYIRTDDPNITATEPLHSFVTGPEMGLILVVNTSSSDYFYSIFNSVGFNIQIFNPDEYPDSTSGSVQERFISPGTETFVRIDANLIQSQDSITQYSPEKVRIGLFN